jgi:hypothetical protein
MEEPAWRPEISLGPRAFAMALGGIFLLAALILLSLALSDVQEMVRGKRRVVLIRAPASKTRVKVPAVPHLKLHVELGERGCGEWASNGGTLVLEGTPSQVIQCPAVGSNQWGSTITIEGGPGPHRRGTNPPPTLEADLGSTEALARRVLRASATMPVTTPHPTDGTHFSNASDTEAREFTLAVVRPGQYWPAGAHAAAAVVLVLLGGGLLRYGVAERAARPEASGRVPPATQTSPPRSAAEGGRPTPRHGPAPTLRG